jgi:sphinganine-1-phosphate aldolase
MHYGSARYIEKELVKISIDLFKGTNKVDDICGMASTGGTESILFAMLSFRERARRRGVTEPEL